jgi:membrane-associated protease RseP (regulator of RpoE activity)
LGILNLLPIRSFDGGRMLECTLYALTDARIASTVMHGVSFGFLLLLWLIAVYFLLRAGDGLSLFCFSLALFLRFFEDEKS